MVRKGKFITIIFALILILPLLDMFFHFSPVKEIFEKRLPVEKPKLIFSAEYARNFEKYFDDNYGFRKTMIKTNSVISDKIFNESPDARAVVGKDGWFYFDNCDSLVDATGKAEIADELVEIGAKHFYQNWQTLKANNIEYLFVIAADKSTVYPEFLPDYIKPSGPHRIDKFIAALKKQDPNFPLLDLRPIMLKAKEKDIIYHQTDTHWNKRGAHAAYLEIFKKLGIKPHPRSDFENKEDELMRGDVSDIMGIDTANIDYNLKPKFQPSYREEDAPEEFKSFHNAYFTINKNKDLPVLFTYKDSYFSDLAPFVSNHFYKSYYANEFPCDINYENIKNFHPNIVIHEFWEGRIEVVLNRCSK